MKILVAGGTGFIGRELCRHLQQNNEIVVKTRRPDLVGSAFKSIKNMSEIGSAEKFDVVVNLAGEPIANKRWSIAQKNTILKSRLSVTEEIISYFQHTIHKPRLFISGSAVGYYGVSSSEEAINEDGDGDQSFSSRLCSKWESTALQAEALGIRTCILRTGIVLGKDGGALKKMLLPFKLCFGGHIGTGSQWMSWIHMSDMIGIIDHCTSEPKISGAINCTAPTPVTNKEFAQTLGKVLRRPIPFNVPTFVINILMGQMGREILLAGKKVVPAKVLSSGYTFRFSRFENALSDVLSKNDNHQI